MTAPSKTVLITGAAQGVGLAAASLLARRAYRVILVDIQSVERQIAELRAGGLQAEGISGDVSSEEFVQRLALKVSQDYGALDALVNNAGVSLIVPAEETTAAQWQRVMAINLFAPFLLCRYLGAQMLQRRQGSIINVASVAGLAGIAHRSAYNASMPCAQGGSKPKWIPWTRVAARTAMRISSTACRLRASRVPPMWRKRSPFSPTRIATDLSMESRCRWMEVGWLTAAGMA